MTNEQMKTVEKHQAEIFLRSYNHIMGTKYYIRRVLNDTEEPPDIECFDEETRQTLYLEMTILENKKGDIKRDFQQQRGELDMTGQSMGVIDFERDILSQLEGVLDDKLKAHYGKVPVALVIGRVYALDARLEWNTLAQQFIGKYFEKYKGNYPMGIWIIILGLPNEEIFKII